MTRKKKEEQSDTQTTPKIPIMPTHAVHFRSPTMSTWAVQQRMTRS